MLKCALSETYVSSYHQGLRRFKPEVLIEKHLFLSGISTIGSFVAGNSDINYKITWKNVLG